MHTVFVLATTPTGTAEALREAQRRADLAGSRISLLVARVMSLESKQSGNPSAQLDAFDAIAADVGVPVTTYACVCHHVRDLAAWFDVGHCTIVVGGRRGSWWRPTAEQRLARALERARQQVVFVDAAV